MTKILRATHIRDHVLELEFSDKTIGEYDFDPVLAKDTSLTRPLGDPAYFLRFFLELGALCWPNGLEFSAEALRRELERAGRLRSVAHVA